jgi:hypothetical protein
MAKEFSMSRMVFTMKVNLHLVSVRAKDCLRSPLMMLNMSTSKM